MEQTGYSTSNRDRRCLKQKSDNSDPVPYLDDVGGVRPADMRILSDFILLRTELMLELVLNHHYIGTQINLRNQYESPRQYVQMLYLSAIQRARGVVSHIYRILIKPPAFRRFFLI